MTQEPQLTAALAAWEQGKVQEALGLLEQIGQGDPQGQAGWQAHMYLLQGYLHTGQADKARQVFKRMQCCSGAYPQVQQWLTQMQQQYAEVLDPPPQAGMVQVSPPQTHSRAGSRYLLRAAALTAMGILGLEWLLIWGLSPASGSLAAVITLLLNGLAALGCVPLLDAGIKRVGGRWLTTAERQRLGITQERIAWVPGGSLWRYGLTPGGTRLVIGQDLWKSLGDPERKALLAWGTWDPALAVLTWGSFWGYGLLSVLGGRGFGLAKGCFYPLLWLARRRACFWDPQGSPAWQQGILNQAQLAWGIALPVGLFAASDPEDWGLLAQVARSPQAPQALIWEQVSPWQKGAAISRPHPLWGKRLTGIPKMQSPQSQEKQEKLTIGMALYLSDVILAVLGWGVGAWLFWEFRLGFWNWMGLASVGAGMGMLLKAWRMFPPGAGQPARISQLYQNLKAQPVIGIPVKVQGRLVRDGVGWWLVDETGKIRLQWLGRLGLASGSLVSLRGWLRRGGRVWIDGDAWSLGQRQGRAWARMPLLAGGILGIAIGVGLLLIPYTPPSRFF